MSRRVAVVGAGQSGALLALALRRDGYDVTLATDRTADQVRHGPVLSSQCMFASALAVESDLGLTHWRGEVPVIDTMSITVCPPGNTHLADQNTLRLLGALDDPAASVDQRLKCALWMDEFVELGGRLEVCEVDAARLTDLQSTHDLTVVATGKGQLAELFAVDHGRTVFDTPQRVSTMAYVTGMSPSPDGAELTMTVVPGVGECLTMPALTDSGQCHIVLIEAVVGGPLDPAHGSGDSTDHLAYVHSALTGHFPEIAARAEKVEITDPHGSLRGALTPTVRRPVASLSCGGRVLGMADVVVLNDPITGQGSNNAVQSAHIYHQAIVARGERAFDEAWMHRTFEKYWRGWGQWSVAWTNSMLSGMPAHVEKVFAEATALPAVATAIVRAFDDPRTAADWWFHPDDATRLLDSARRDAQSVVDRRELRRALGHYATGVTVITATTPEGRKVGITANSFTSVSLDPPLVSFCPARTAPSLPDFHAAGRFAVNILAADQHDLSRQFATPSPDKFAGVEHSLSEHGTPLLDRVVARFECRTVQHVDAGDHVIVLGEVEDFSACGGEPLVFHSGGYRLVTTHPDYS
ncbi:flavin reductase [Gordonia sp. 852002-10350_SCH5691597]|uniref:flavin reductase n=1 Tax=Gordonia sp. 852002-10350_SCH5691597 TaxID=1834085 RepID=UPI0007EAE4B0|nr:flavin reductase [Gordonia sp. 852002-10350_SCH5691597]OBA68466.1 flavin oxidoreductase [Gordonia sp. 852002-10350_SCH5691597]